MSYKWPRVLEHSTDISVSQAYYYNLHFYICGIVINSTFSTSGAAPYIMKASTDGEVEYFKLLNYTDAIESEYFKCTGLIGASLSCTIFGVSGRTHSL